MVGPERECGSGSRKRGWLWVLNERVVVVAPDREGGGGQVYHDNSDVSRETKNGNLKVASCEHHYPSS